MTTMKHIICILSSIVFLAAADKVIMTNNGQIQGVTVSSGEPTVEAFLGIPFAEPPVGRLRFSKPVPKKSWSGVYEATQQPPACIQTVSNHYYEPNTDNMTEDCLYLNMWVPYSQETSKLKPIMIFTHGGAFIIGSGNMQVYDGTNMARFGDVIVANMNYRLGAFGFLLAYIEEADGSMGVFDQILAVKWIKDNAKAFGGDPDNIVLIGESAGAMIIGAHLSSPLTKNLFKRVIMESGSPTMAMSLDNNTGLYETSQRLAVNAGCADKTLGLKDDPHLVVECLKRLPTKVIKDAEARMTQTNPLTFRPRIYDDYLPQPPTHLLKQGDFKDTEMLIGTNTAEGSLFLTVAAPEYFGEYGANRVNSLSKRLASQMVRLMFKTVGLNNNKAVADFYIGSIQNGTVDEYVDGIVDAIGDYFITCSTYYQAELYSLRNPVYYYVMTRRPSSTPLAEWMNVTHFDEIQYVFGNPLFQNFTPEEEAFSNRIMARWIAFAKTGNPNLPGLVEWPKFTLEDPQYLELDDVETVRSRPDNKRCEFWREQYETIIDEEVISRIKRQPNGGLHVASGVFQTVASVLLTTAAFREQ